MHAPTLPASLVALDSISVRPAKVAWAPIDTRTTDNGWWTDGRTAFNLDAIKHKRLATRMRGFLAARNGRAPVPLAPILARNHALSAVAEVIGVEIRPTDVDDDAAPWAIVREPSTGEVCAFNAWLVRAALATRPDSWRTGTIGTTRSLMAYRGTDPVALVMGITLPDSEKARVRALVGAP